MSHPSVSNSHSENCQECQGNADALWRFLAALGERDAVCSAEYHRVLLTEDRVGEYVHKAHAIGDLMAELDADHEPDTDELDTIADRKVSGLLRLMDALCEELDLEPETLIASMAHGYGPEEHDAVPPPMMPTPPEGSYLVCGCLTQRQLDGLREDTYRHLRVYHPDRREWCNGHAEQDAEVQS